jgi:argininosuccinate synthase
MTGTRLLQSLNTIAGTYKIGRFIYTGDCIIGIKGRIAFECSGLYSLIIAHKALEDTTLSKEQNQFKQIISQKWAHLVYSGLYFDPLRQNLEIFLDDHQYYVTGTVTLKLTTGTALPVKYSSPFLIQEKNTVYAQSASWKPDEAEGFIKLIGMSTILAQRGNCHD